jgi:quercetin dioxygenase-like cupin family protein
MKLSRVMALATVAFAVSTAHADSSPSIQKEVLSSGSTSWDGTLYTAYPAGAPELSVLKITIAPHATLPWHSHPIPNAAYVVSGELTVEKQSTGEKKVLTAGQVLPELVGQVHRGTAGDEPVVLIVFYAGTKGTPLAQ